MNTDRIYGIIVRHLYSVKHNYDRISDVLYWPAIDMLVWGLMSSYITSQTSQGFNLLFVILSGLVFWTLSWRLPYEVCITLLDDMWSKNLINIFVSPLTFSEWLTATTIVSAGKTLASFVWSAMLAFFLYKVGILIYGIWILPFMLLLMITGWTLGFLISALILRFGMKVQAFGWTLGALIMPFSAIYYPVSILPKWAQIIAHVVPASYVFEGVRQFANTGTINMQGMIICLVLNVLYLLLAIFSLRQSFKGMLKRGVLSYY